MAAAAATGAATGEDLDPQVQNDSTGSAESDHLKELHKWRSF